MSSSKHLCSSTPIETDEACPRRVLRRLGFQRHLFLCGYSIQSHFMYSVLCEHGWLIQGREKAGRGKIGKGGPGGGWRPNQKLMLNLPSQDLEPNTGLNSWHSSEETHWGCQGYIWDKGTKGVPKNQK